eukprot:jgi/Chlat1/1723/Chrsp13S02160
MLALVVALAPAAWLCKQTDEWRTADCELAAHLLNPHDNAHPEVTRNNTTVIGSPGASFGLKCRATACELFERTHKPVVVEISINGKRRFQGEPVAIKGWLAAANSSRYKRFIFSPPGAAASGEASVPSAGKITIEAFVEQDLGATSAPAPRAHMLSTQCVKKLLGEKFFKVASLTVDADNKIGCSPKTSYQVVRGRDVEESLPSAPRAGEASHDAACRGTGGNDIALEIVLHVQ